VTGEGALPVLHLDERMLVVDKPAGLLVHPTRLDAHEEDTAWARAQAQVGGRLWPAHRLDKGTSGVLVFARDAEAARALGQAFEEGRVVKHYLALVRGWPAPVGQGGTIEHPLARDPERPSAGQPHREAVTHWTCLAHHEWPLAVDPRHATARYALVQAQPLTGRRHQIRRHFKHIGHPLIGDSTHGKGPHNRAVAAWLGEARLWLHAMALTLPHPDAGQPLALTAVPGVEWAALLGPDEGGLSARAGWSPPRPP
jgi:tRNA pseudouridine65 synthase